MAIGLPTSKLTIVPNLAYARGYPILSGEGDASELVIGIRGLTQQVNYRYSLGRTLFSLSQWADPGDLDFGDFFFETSSASYGGATGYVACAVSADVSGLTLSADVDNLDVRLEIEGAATGSGAGNSGRALVTDTTLTVTSGVVLVRVEAKTNTAGTGQLFSVTIRENTLVSGDFP